MVLCDEVLGDAPRAGEDSLAPSSFLSSLSLLLTVWVPRHGLLSFLPLLFAVWVPRHGFPRIICCSGLVCFLLSDQALVKFAICR